MSVSFYFDEHVPFWIAETLRRRRVDVLIAQEDGHDETPDPIVLDRATSLERVMFTQDEDFLVETTARVRRSAKFAGVIFARQIPHLLTRYMTDLELIGLVGSPEEFRDRVTFLPYR